MVHGLLMSPKDLPADYELIQKSQELILINSIDDCFTYDLTFLQASTK